MSDGERFGPGRVEECLTAHPDVALAAVIGVPDPDHGEIVKAFVVPRAGVAPEEGGGGRENGSGGRGGDASAGRGEDGSAGGDGSGLRAALLARGRQALPPHAAPREIEFVGALPRTTTGKIMRRELRRREVDRQRGEGRRTREVSSRPRDAGR